MTTSEPHHTPAVAVSDPGAEWVDLVFSQPFASPFATFWATLRTRRAALEMLPPPLPPMVLHLLNTCSVLSRVEVKSAAELALLTSPNWSRNVIIEESLDVDIAALAPRLRRVMLCGYHQTGTTPPASAGGGFSLNLLRSLANLPKLSRLCLAWNAKGRIVVNPLQDFPALTHLDVTSANALRDDDLLGVELLPHLSILIVASCDGLSELSFLERCASLTHLNVSGVPNLTTESVAAIARIPTLKELNVDGAVAARTRIGAAILAGARTLEYLALGSSLEPVDLAGLEQCTRLKKLHMRCEVGGLDAFQHAPQLQTLDVYGVVSCVAQLLQAATMLPALTDLSVNTAWGDFDAAPVSKCTKLKRLVLHHPTTTQADATGFHLLPFCEGCSIETLSLSHPKGIDGLALKQLPRLTELELDCAGFDDEGLAVAFDRSPPSFRRLHLRNLSQLSLSWLPQLVTVTFLSLRDSPPSQLRNDCVANIAAMPALTTLVLEGCPHVTDLRPIVTSPRLQTLLLSDSGVKDDTFGVPGESMRTLGLRSCSQLSDVQLFIAAPSLRALHVVDMPGIPDVAALQQLVPSRTRVYDWIFST